MSLCVLWGKPLLNKGVKKPMKLKEKVAVITGAAQGLGAHFAVGLASEGAHVLVADIIDGSKVAQGIIDNGGLFFGMDALDPFLPKGKLIKAGWGNIFADSLGGILSTFVGVMIKSYTGIDDTPIWSSTIGIIIGGFVGLYISSFISGKR